MSLMKTKISTAFIRRRKNILSETPRGGPSRGSFFFCFASEKLLATESQIIGFPPDSCLVGVATASIPTSRGSIDGIFLSNVVSLRESRSQELLAYKAKSLALYHIAVSRTIRKATASIPTIQGPHFVKKSHPLARMGCFLRKWWAG